MMWYYLWAHSAYHLVRWFPQNNRVKIFVLMMVFTLALLVPQVYVLLHDHSARWCAQPLLQLLIVSIILTFFVIGFTFLFMVMIPVPREIKIAFHIFGLVCFIESIVEIVLTTKSEQCKNTTEDLYKISVAYMWLAILSIAFLVIMLPFWIINKIKKNSVLNHRERKGLCYEPVNCCSCLWHV